MHALINGMRAATGGHVTAIQVSVVVLLVCLLVQKEILRIIGTPRTQRWMPVLDAAIWPLLVVSAGIFVARTIALF